MDVGRKSVQKKCNKFLYFATITANLLAYSFGGACVWSSPAIPRLNGQIDPENNPLSQNITTSEESWIASLLPLGCAFSAFISGYLADKIGRKWTLLLSSIPTIAGFTFLTFGNVIVHFYLGRFLCGLGSGTLFTVLPIYIGEIAENSNRSTLGCYLMFFITAGNLVTYVMTPYVTLKVLTATNLIAPIIFLIVFGIFVPESPYYYVKKNKIDLAEISLLKFRYNNQSIVKEELSNIIASIKASFDQEINIRVLYKDKAIVRGCYIAFGLGCFQQWSGINVIFFYMQSIFQEINIGISAENCVILVGIIQFLATACTVSFVDKFGSKILLLISSMGCVLSLIVTGIFFYVKETTSIEVSNINWLPILSISMFIISYSLGLGAITFAVIGVIFPPHVKAMASTVTIFLTVFSTFCVTNLFPYLKYFIGVGLSMCLFALICCAAFVFIYFKVPETKGKSLQDIQKLLRL